MNAKNSSIYNISKNLKILFFCARNEIFLDWAVARIFLEIRNTPKEFKFHCSIRNDAIVVPFEGLLCSLFAMWCTSYLKLKL